MEIEVTVPSILSNCTGGKTSFTLEPDAPTLGGALQSLFRRYPLLRVHLFDEQERVRPHVLIFHNSDNLSRRFPRDAPMDAGDRLQVLQNVSGG